MKESRTAYFIGQVLFFTVSTLILHVALFDFIGGYLNGRFRDSNHLTETILNWLPVIAIDAFAGLFIGILNSLFSVLIMKNVANIPKVVITTDIIWILFCFIWYFNNRGYINTEALGHVISPFIVGFVGVLLAVVSLIAATSLNHSDRDTQLAGNING